MLRRSLVRVLAKRPFDFAHYLCVGAGLEIGAMKSPYTFSGKCVVKYADIFDTDELRDIVGKIPIPGLYKGAYAPLSYILKPPRYGLEIIESDTFDFVYSSHSLEYTPNPIWALIEQLRVIKPGGIVYVVIPNKNYTYDAGRTSTPAQILIKKYLDFNFENSLEEALDVVLNTVGHPIYESYRENSNFYAQQILDKKEGTHHFYVFDEQNTLAMLIFVEEIKRAKIEYFSAVVGGDIHFALRNTCPY